MSVVFYALAAIQHVGGAYITEMHQHASGNAPEKMNRNERLGSWLFIGALALVLFQFLSRIKLRAADHAFV
jgi:drug/metabolite transporter superfamily protein YnfA